MRNTITILLLLFCSALYGQVDTIKTSEVSGYVGKEVVVRGVVSEKRYFNGGNGSVFYLNFDKAYPDNLFSVVLYGDDILLCEGDVLDYIKFGGIVTVIGVIERVEYRGNVRYRIVVQNCKQFVSF